MKKSLLALATAMVCLLGFTACDDDPAALEELIEQNDLIGHITLTTSNATAGTQSSVQAYGNGNTVTFKSAVSNVRFDTIYAADNITISDVTVGTLMVGTKDNAVTHGEEELEPPFIGIHLRDTNTGHHTVSCPVDRIEFFQYLYESNVASLMLSGVNVGGLVGNLFAIVCPNDSYYIGYEGDINITEFGLDGGLVKGSISVKAIYITAAELEQVANNQEYQQGIQNLATHFPNITFSGELSGRRADITAIVNALEVSE